MISRLVKKFDVEVNILFRGADALKTTVVGNLLISLTGPAVERRKAHLFLEEQGVIFEVIRK